MSYNGGNWYFLQREFMSIPQCGKPIRLLSISLNPQTVMMTFWHFDCSRERLYMLITYYHYCIYLFFFLPVGLLGLCVFVLFYFWPLCVTAVRVTIWCLGEIRTIFHLEIKCMISFLWHSSNHLSLVPWEMLWNQGAEGSCSKRCELPAYPREGEVAVKRLRASN